VACNWYLAFLTVRDLRVQALVKANIPTLLSQAAQASPYSVAELGITGLLHFVYKSRTLVQVTHPQWDATVNQPRYVWIPYACDTTHLNAIPTKRLVTLYQTIHDALHAKSGQPSGPIKLQLIRTDTECVMGWASPPFVDSHSSLMHNIL
jgi:hypothetical protein